MGVPTIPGVEEAIQSEEDAEKFAEFCGYPVMLKASAGGGGRGMRIVRRPEDLISEFNNAQSEARKAFGIDDIFIEKYLEEPKHIEVLSLIHIYPMRFLVSEIIREKTLLYLKEEVPHGIAVEIEQYEEADDCTNKMCIRDRNLNEEDGMTVVMVSHDIKEALIHAGKILHLRHDDYFFGTVEEYRRSPYYDLLQTEGAER